MTVDPKLALVLEGPGFYEQNEICEILTYQGYRVVRKIVGFDSDKLFIPEFEQAGFILMRGPWCLSIEDRLMSRVIADRLSLSFQAAFEKGSLSPEQTIVGIGRGALVLFDTPYVTAAAFDSVTWRPALENEGPWVSVSSDISKTSVNAMVLGRAVPQILPGTFEGFQDWLSHPRFPVGWRKGKIFLSTVDILGFSDRSQHSDFGYVDLTSIPTQPEILSKLTTGEF